MAATANASDVLSAGQTEVSPFPSSWRPFVNLAIEMCRDDLRENVAFRRGPLNRVQHVAVLGRALLQRIATLGESGSGPHLEEAIGT